MSAVTIRPEDVPASPRQEIESLVSAIHRNGQHFAVQDKSTYLQTSPYEERGHQLDLSSLDVVHRIFARALTVLEPVTPYYATTEYEEVFNWSTVLTTVRNLSAVEGINFPRTEFFVVDFRTQLQSVIDQDLLSKLDKESHLEANAAGGLLKYWFGIPDSDRRNLATCFWRSKVDAIEGGKGRWHKQAQSVVGQMYESINVAGLRLIVEENAASLKVEPWPPHQAT